MATVLSDVGEMTVGEMTVGSTKGLWLSAENAARAAGWTLKPEGMCQAELCVPLPATAVQGDRVE